MMSGRHKPSFFKVMVGNFQNKMRIPRGFIKNFNGNAPKNVFLRSSTGSSWTVPVIQICDDLFLCNTWWSFATDHALEYGDFLVFEYHGHADFTVKIFTKTACEKEIPIVKESTKPVNFHPQVPGISCEKASKMITPVEYAIDAAKAPHCDNPNFIVVMRPSYVDRRKPYLTLALPHTFGSEYLGESPLNITLHNSDGNAWDVQYRTGTQYRLAKGWKAFVLENHLQLGDVCRFELRAKSPGHADLKFSVIGISNTT